MKNLIKLFIISLLIISCNKEDINPTTSTWIGTWNVKKVLLDDILQETIRPPDGFQIDYMEITIPPGDTGIVSGNTFKNGISFGFKLLQDERVKFGLVGGTRAGEDKYGFAFVDHIGNVNSFFIENDTMHFKDINGNTLILFTKP